MSSVSVAFQLWSLLLCGSLLRGQIAARHDQFVGRGTSGITGHATRDTRDTSVLLDSVVLQRDNMASIGS